MICRCRHPHTAFDVLPNNVFGSPAPLLLPGNTFGNDHVRVSRITLHENLLNKRLRRIQKTHTHDISHLSLSYYHTRYTVTSLHTPIQPTRSVHLCDPLVVTRFSSFGPLSLPCLSVRCSHHALLASFYLTFSMIHDP